MAALNPLRYLPCQMTQILDDGKTISFGQSQEKIEQLFGCKAIDKPIRIARKGIDQSLKTGDVSFEFDSGKLKRIIFESEYGFRNPPQPYPEAWKNFPIIGATGVSRKMSRDEFLSYLDEWEKRAKASGAERVEAGEDLNERQYQVGIIRDDFADMVVVNMGPSRRAGGGGLWCDGWCLFFATESDHQQPRVETGRLRSLSVFRDEFNTMARRVMASPQT
jgi:hypothetical protein